MQAFHNDPTVKQKYIDRVREHRVLDHLVKGATGQGGKGCAVWCTMNAYDHKAYEREIGVPEWLARIEDTIFEGLPQTEAMRWPERFLSAIRPGADLEKIKGPFLVFVLESTLDKFDHAKFPDVKKCVDDVIALWKREDINSDSWRAAAAAAAAAAWRAAADAAAAAAAAAWRAADAAAAAADAAADAAAAAAWRAAARQATYKKFADKLIELLASL